VRVRCGAHRAGERIEHLDGAGAAGGQRPAPGLRAIVDHEVEIPRSLAPPHHAQRRRVQARHLRLEHGVEHGG